MRLLKQVIYESGWKTKYSSLDLYMYHEEFNIVAQFKLHKMYSGKWKSSWSLAVCALLITVIW